MTTRELGIPGVALSAGDHVCGFYYGEQERDALLLPYLLTGLRDGDKCLAVVDSTTPEQVAARIGDDIDIDGCLHSRQLELWDTDDTYLRTGTFSAELMIDFWEQRAGDAITDDGYTFARMLGEMSWLSRAAPPREAVVAYETWADRFAPHQSGSILCLYDVSKVGAGLLLDLLKTHRRILVNGIVVENPHYLTDDEFVAQQVTTRARCPNGSDLGLRGQLSDLRGLLALSMVMTGRHSEDEIISLAMTAAPRLGRCRMVGVYVDEEGGPPGNGLPAELRRRVATSGNVEGDTVPRIAGIRSFPLHSLDGVIGHLVIAADEELSTAELLLTGTLAQQTGVALANARLHRRERTVSEDLRATVAELARTVQELEYKNAVHDRFIRVATGDTGQQGIVDALFELTRFPASIEDRHGNLVAWAGGKPPSCGDRMSAADLTKLLPAAVRGRPIRVGRRLVAVARPRSDVVGVLTLLDPDGVAGAQEIMALEHGAVVLAMELARLRSVADTELRLGRDVVADLIGGDAEVGLARARALGYDLARPHRVVVVEQIGPAAATDTLLTAVREAARTVGASLMFMPRAETVVLLATDAPDDGDRWSRLGAAVLAELGHRCLVGVGTVCRRPEDFARSHHEAELCGRLLHSTGDPGGVAVYENLGVYQLLSEVPDPQAVPRFIRRWLGALLDYDTSHSASLVFTLSRFLEGGGNYDTAAAALSIGRSTLRYRLQRIHQLSGHDLADPDTRFNLQLATRAWQMLHPDSPASRHTECAGWS